MRRELRGIIVLPDNSILITANMQSETGFPSSHQLKSYVASKSRLKLAARSVLSADAGLVGYAIGQTDTDTVIAIASYFAPLLGRSKYEHCYKVVILLDNALQEETLVILL